MNVLSLCAGVGGLDLGLAIALGDAHRTVGYCERDAAPAAALVARMDEAALDRAPVYGDLESFPCDLYRGKVDIVTAGFPCQPWSVAGKRLGIRDPRWLWPRIGHIIRQVEPGIVFLENVPGLANGEDERDEAGEPSGWRFPPGTWFVFGELAELGFDAEWLTLPADAVGASQERRRIFILAWHKGRGRGVLRRAWECFGLAQERDGELAGANGERPIGTNLVRQLGGGRPSIVHGQLADAARLSGGQRPIGERIRGGSGALGHPASLDEPDGRQFPAGGCEIADRGSGLHVADAGPGPVPRALGQPQGRAGPRPAIPLFPPGPGLAGDRVINKLIELFARSPESAWRRFTAERANTLRWAAILEHYPWLAPSISAEQAQHLVSKLADGATPWMDPNRRIDPLRCGGNGVVAVQAAAAFVELVRRAVSL